MGKYRIIPAAMIGFVLLLNPLPIGSAHARPPSGSQNKPVSPEGLLNADGSLRLDGDFSGSLDLSDWDVRIDSERGPVFAPPQQPEASPLNVGGSSLWSALGGNGAGDGSLNDTVFAIAVSGTNVYVAGGFTDVNNGGTVLNAADYIAKWDGNNWSALGSNGAGDGSLNDPVFAIAVSGSNVYAGGSFQNVNNGGTVLNAADHIAKWDGSNWSALGGNGAGDGSLNDHVTAIAVSGSDVYVGGTFINVNNGGTLLNAADYIAKWDGGNWSALGSNGADDGSLTRVVDSVGTDAVTDIEINGSDVYVGGDFTNVNNGGTVLNDADYIAKWDGSDWSALGGNGAGDGSLNEFVLDIAISGPDVYVGGWFVNVNDNGTLLNAADYIAKWDGGNWSALGSNGAGDGSLSEASFLVPGVEAIAVRGSDVYIGGGFLNVNNNGTVLNAADYAAKWDGSNWSALSNNGAGGGSLDYDVMALAVGAADVYAGGYFSDVNDQGIVRYAADYMAAYSFTHTFYMLSIGANDGWVLESTETSGTGGSHDSTGSTFSLGDDARDRQYRAILHFDTSGLPDNAVIVSATLRFKRRTTVGVDPFTTHSRLLADIRSGAFNGNAALEDKDFNAAASASNVAIFNNPPVDDWYSAALNTTSLSYINLTGTTQFRLGFRLDDDDDLTADFVIFFSGDFSPTTSIRPVLEVRAYVP